MSPSKHLQRRSRLKATRTARERLYLYDTTLRDGAQTQGVDFSLEDKWLIAQQLDVLGLDYIEAGYPGANPTDTRLFATRAQARLGASSPPSA